MSYRTQLLLLTGVCALSYAFGRYTAPSTPSVRVSEQVREAQHETDHKVETTHSVCVIRREPSGVVTKTVATDTKVADQIIEHVNTTASIEQTITPARSATLNVSALAGYDFLTGRPMYGAAFSKQLIGPITVGAWGLTNGAFAPLVGVSLGLNF